MVITGWNCSCSRRVFCCWWLICKHFRYLISQFKCSKAEIWETEYYRPDIWIPYLSFVHPTGMDTEHWRFFHRLTCSLVNNNINHGITGNWVQTEDVVMMYCHFFSTRPDLFHDRYKFSLYSSSGWTLCHKPLFS